MKINELPSTMEGVTERDLYRELDRVQRELLNLLSSLILSRGMIEKLLERKQILRKE